MTAPTPLAAPLRPPHRRLPRAARWGLAIVGGLALLLSTVWVGAYFWLGSSSGRARLGELAMLPAGVSVGAVRWGPALDEVALGAVTVRAPDGRELLNVRTAALDIGLAAFFAGDLVLDSLDVEVSHIDASATKDGQLELAAVLAPAKPAAVVGAAPGAAKPGAVPTVTKLDVRIAEVWIDLSDVQGHLRDLRITGSLTGGPSRPRAHLELATGPCHAMWNKARRSVGFDGCRAVADVDATRLDIAALELGGPREVLVMGGTVEMAGAIAHGRFHGWGRFGATEADALAPGSFPAGFDFDGLELDIEGGHLEGSLGQFVAPRWAAGPFSADHVALGVERFTAAPGLLVPELRITVAGLAAARLSGLDWVLEGLWLPRARADLDKKLAAETAGWSSAWTMPTGEVGPVDLRLATLLKLTGGQIEGSVESGQGLVFATGNLKSSPLTKRTSFVADIRFSDVTGPLADALLHDVSDTQRGELGRHAFGSVEVDVDVDRADRFSPWVTELEWALGRIDGGGCRLGADHGAEPCASLEWDGYAWARPSVVAEPP